MNSKERIEKVMEHKGCTPSVFASMIGIQGSTLSHILNGRNNASIDVLTKILNRYTDISVEWLIMGSGPMFRQITHSHPVDLFANTPEISSETVNYEEKKPVFSPNPVITNRTKEPEQVVAPVNIPLQQPPKTITRVLVFYSDNSFEELNR